MTKTATQTEQLIINKFIQDAQEIVPGTRLRWVLRSSESASSMVAAVRLPGNLNSSDQEVFNLHDLSGQLSEDFDFDFSITTTGLLAAGDKLSLHFISDDHLSIEPDVSPWFARYEMALAERTTSAHDSQRDLCDALELAVRQYGAQSPPVIETLQMLAQIYLHDLGEPNKSVLTLMAAMALQDAEQEAPSLGKLDVLDALVHSLLEDNQSERALEFSLQSLRMREELLGVTDWSTINHLCRLAQFPPQDPERRRLYYSQARDRLQDRLNSQDIDFAYPEKWNQPRLPVDLGLAQVGELEKFADLLHVTSQSELESRWRIRLEEFWKSYDSEKRDWFRLGIIEVHRQKGEPQFVLQLLPLSRANFSNRVAIFSSFQDFKVALKSVDIVLADAAESEWPMGARRCFLVGDVSRETIEGILERPEYGTY